MVFRGHVSVREDREYQRRGGDPGNHPEPRPATGFGHLDLVGST
jgi:hypothetical protein